MHSIDIITLFPEMFSALNYGILGRAIEKNLLDIKLWNPRDFTTDPHRTVDDNAYGGGPGMVMKFEPLFATIQAAKARKADKHKVVYLSPQGQKLTQAMIKNTAHDDMRLILIAGRYEGIDERLIEKVIDEEWSIGDYVLSGGEFAAMVIIDAVARLLPGALGDKLSAEQDSFQNGLLDHPHYTRPEEIAGSRVPHVLLKGNHQAIAEWRLQQAVGRTWLRRPDLLAARGLSQKEQQLLDIFIKQLPR